MKVALKSMAIFLSKKKNQNTRWSHRSLEKQFQSMKKIAQSKSYAISLRENNYYLLFENGIVDYF